MDTAKWKYSVEYCEEHECDECYIYKNNLDNRIMRDDPCCENIYLYLDKHNLNELPE